MSEPEDTCRPVEIDGQVIRVRGAREMNETDKAALSEIVRAAQGLEGRAARLQRRGGDGDAGCGAVLSLQDQRQPPAGDPVNEDRVGTDDMPRILTPEQQADARLIGRARCGIDEYKPGRGIFHWSVGPYWPKYLRQVADRMERLIPALRRMADFLEANQPADRSSSTS